MQARMEILQNSPSDAQETTKKVPSQNPISSSAGPTLKKELQPPSQRQSAPSAVVVSEIPIEIAAVRDTMMANETF